ncbi:acetylxylan esterase [bacterium BMS3Abin03]|nr:acetylxylan esterase [bacterium BMS3Abin03]
MKNIYYTSLLILFIICKTFGQIETKELSDSLLSPVTLTAEQDHARLMKLLGIDSLRPGPSGDPKSPDAANTDESIANPYPNLPDPLTLNNGQKVTTAEMWWKQRRPEIKEFFDREIYGRVPENVPKVNWEVVSVTKDTIQNIPAITKKLLGHVDNSSYPLISVDIDLTLVTPTNFKEPVPVMMEFGFKFPANFKMTDQMKKYIDSMSTWRPMVLSKGWGYAILVPTSFQADNGKGLTDGIIGLVNKGQPRKLDDWGTLRAWAWGASRALDYLISDKSIDGNKVVIEGLSRYGKAALVTMAYDQRFAIGFIGSSGEGGVSLLRRNFGEMIENVASTSEYHWMAGNFLKYAGPLTAKDLPVDAHELIAMCAPRPVFISCGSPEIEGNWVDDKGQFMAAVEAGPVYKLLGKTDLGTNEMPPIGTPLIDGDIAFRQHFGGHTTLDNWPTFIKFAEKYFNKK